MNTTPTPAGADLPQGALTDEDFKDALRDYARAFSSRDRLHLTYMGKEMSDAVYDTFATLRDDTIPALESKLLAALAARPGATAAAGVLGWRVEGGPLGPTFTHHQVQAELWIKEGRTVTPLAAQTETQPASDAVEMPDEGELEEWRSAADDLLREIPNMRGPTVRRAALLLQNAYLFGSKLIHAQPAPAPGAGKGEKP